MSQILPRTKGVPRGRTLPAMESAAPSPFLEVPEAEWVCANTLAFAIYDSFPVSSGHVLVITRYAGDMGDPRGGGRHVILEKGNYLAAEKVWLTELQNLRGSPDSFHPKAWRIAACISRSFVPAFA
jgi:hypothetical protein